MESRPYRRPVWQPGKLSRFASLLKDVPKQVTLSRIVCVFVLPVLFYVYREVTHDALIIDPFTVPKRFEEAGLTSEVVANRIGDALREIEITTQTRMKKDNLSSLRDEGSMPDVEIPGTKVGLKTMVEITRTVFGIYPNHVSGDIVVRPTGPANAEAQATVTFYITQGRSRSRAISLVVTALDIGLLAQRTAEMVLGQVNPYVLAAYRVDHHEFEEAVEIIQRIIRNPPKDRTHISAAFILWGNILSDPEKGKYDEAVAMYQKAIDLSPNMAVAHLNLGILLAKQKKYGKAGAKFREAIKFDPNLALAYLNWGVALDAEKKDDEAGAKFQKAIELNPKDASACKDWGIALFHNKKYDQAGAMFEKAIGLNPMDAGTYWIWGLALDEHEKYDEAGAKFQKVIELHPKNADAYRDWGIVLYHQKKYDDAEKKFAKARELSSSQ